MGYVERSSATPACTPSDRPSRADSRISHRRNWVRLERVLVHPYQLAHTSAPLNIGPKFVSGHGVMPGVIGIWYAIVDRRTAEDHEAAA